MIEVREERTPRFRSAIIGQTGLYEVSAKYKIWYEDGKIVKTQMLPEPLWIYERVEEKPVESQARPADVVSLVDYQRAA